MQNRNHLIRIIVIILFALALIILFVVPAFRYLVLDRSAINNEISRLNLATSYQEQKENYSSGFCFDNCPSTQITYSLQSLANSKILNDLEAILINNGYQHTSISDNSVMGTKDNGRYFVEAFTLKGNSYEGVKADVPVNKLIVRLTYNHNLSH